MKTKLSDELDSWEYKVKVRMRNDIKSIQWMWSNSCKIEGGRCHISKNVMTDKETKATRKDNRVDQTYGNNVIM